MRVLKDPFAQFLTIGALIFLIYSFSNPAKQVEASNRIAVDGPTQDWLYDNFKKQFRRTPSRMEMGALIQAHIEHELKYREALALGLDEGDSIVRRRMMQKFDFLFGHGAADFVPDDTILENWRRAHAREFSEPARVSFTHLWFSPDKRGNAVKTDAETALAALPSDSQPMKKQGAEVYGDRFPLDIDFRQATREAVRSVLGPEFTRAVFEAPLSQWFGPVESGLGLHLVRVTEVTERNLLPLDEVREAVLAHWRLAESKRILDEMLATLRADYEVEIDEVSLLGFDYAPDALDVPNVPKEGIEAVDSTL